MLRTKIEFGMKVLVIIAIVCVKKSKFELRRYFRRIINYTSIRPVRDVNHDINCRDHAHDITYVYMHA